MHVVFTILDHDSDYQFLWVSDALPSPSPGEALPQGMRSSTHSLIGTTAIDNKRAEQLRQQIQSAVRLLSFSTAHSATAGDSSINSETAASLTGLGKLLFGRLLPSTIQEQIQALPESSTIQLVINDANNLPWELLHDGDNFLVLKHTVSRLIPLERPQPRRAVNTQAGKATCLLLGNPTDNLPGAITEIAKIEDILYVARERATYRSLYGNMITPAMLAELLATHAYDLIHFAGHANATSLTLADGDFHIKEIENALHSHPIVVLNACATAGTSAEPINFSDVVRNCESLATAFIRAGATAVIGMLWPIPDNGAYFSEVLYQRLAAGETIGSALCASRLALQERDPASIGWLAPVLFGNPGQRPFAMEIKETIGTVLCLTFPPTLDSLADPKAPLANHAHHLHRLVERVEGYGGNIITATQIHLLVAFGLTPIGANSTLTAIRAARDLMAQLDLWQSAAPCIAIASGELAALAHMPDPTRISANTAMLLLGTAVLEVQQLCALEKVGEILLNERARERSRQRYHADLYRPAEQSSTAPAAYILNSTSQATARDTVAFNFDVTIGRATEQAQLQSAWQAVVEGRGQVVNISGDAGIGKSHLLETLKRRISNGQAQWIEVGCTLHVQNTPYGLLTQFMQQLLGLAEHSTKAAIHTVLEQHLNAVSAAELAVLADLLGAQETLLPRQEQAVYQHQLYSCFTQLLMHAVQAGPLVLVVEDAHWSDAASLEILALLVNQIDDVPILFCTLHRPGWQPPWDNRGSHRFIHLRALAPQEQKELYAKLLGTTELPQQLVALLARTDGNPLFLTEILVTLLQRRILRPDDASTKKWQMSDLFQAQDLPDSVQRVIDMRMAQLSADARRVLTMASLFDADFSPAMLQWGLAMSQSQLYEQLSILTQDEFLRQRFGSDRYSFRHALIRDAVYLKIPDAQRQLWHRQIAITLEQSAATGDSATLAALTHHYYHSLLLDPHAEEPVLDPNAETTFLEKAGVYLLQSGANALAHFGGHEAVELFTRALRVQNAQPRQIEPFAHVHDCLGRAFEQISNFRQAEKEYATAHAILHELPMSIELRVRVADLARRLARLHMRWATYDIAEAWIDSGLERVQRRADRACQSTAALLEIHAGAIAYDQGALADATERCQAGLERAQAIADPEVEAEGHLIMGAILQTNGQYSESLTHYREALAHFQQQQNDYQIHRVLGNIGVVYYSLGDWSEALAHFQKAREFWQTIGELDLLAMSLVNMGLVEVCRGNLTQANEHYEEALALWKRTNSQRSLAHCYSNLASLSIEMESWTEADSFLSLSQQIIDEHEVQDLQPDLLCSRALVTLATGRPNQALEFALQAEQLARKQRQELETASALRVQGQIQRALQDNAQALALLEASLQIVQRLGARYETARTFFQLALTKEMATDFDGAQRYCQQAQEHFERLNAMLDLKRTHALADRLSSCHETKTQ